MSFSKLKSASNGGIAKLSEELAKLNGGGNNKGNDGYWYPNVDKVGNGFALIRFLPAPDGEDFPFVRYWDHGFKGPTGKWYVEKSRTTIGESDPVADANSVLWNSGIESDKKIVSERKRRLNYVANILVLKDPANPENEGKVFLFNFGKKIFDKIVDATTPQFEGDDPLNPFDFWSGANFRLKIRKVEGYRNYDLSAFDPPSPLFDNDEAMEEVWLKEKPLQPIIDPSTFKSYEELQKKLDMVLGIGQPASKARTAMDDDEIETAPPAAKSTAAAAFSESKAKALPWAGDGDEDEEEGLEYFKKLANQED